MLEKLLLAAALTLSLQIFAGADRSAKLPKGDVFPSSPNPVTAMKRYPRCSTLACSGNELRRILLATESATYAR
jgi:hypothetical protein